MHSGSFSAMPVLAGSAIFASPCWSDRTPARTQRRPDCRLYRRRNRVASTVLPKFTMRFDACRVAFDLLTHRSIRSAPKELPDLAISARSTVQSQKLRPPAAPQVDAARNIGLRSISFLAADVSSEAFNRPGTWNSKRQDQIALAADQIVALDAEVDALIAAGECGGFVVESPEKLRRIVDHFRCHLSLSRTGCSPLQSRPGFQPFSKAAVLCAPASSIAHLGPPRTERLFWTFSTARRRSISVAASMFPPTRFAGAASARSIGKVDQALNRRFDILAATAGLCVIPLSIAASEFLLAVALALRITRIICMIRDGAPLPRFAGADLLVMARLGRPGGV